MFLHKLTASKRWLRFVVGGVLLSFCVGTVHSQTDTAISGYLREHSQAPVDYVMSKATTHQITIIGEGHWIQHDVNLVAALIPRLQKADIDLASELFPASEQSRIDELITAAKWNAQAANAIMRVAEWPYQEYRDLLHTAWLVNRDAKQPIKILAIGPPVDWRPVLIPKGQSYESFMADLVLEHIARTQRRVVVYCGEHHAFTRYYQAELNNAGKATAYMDRMGNLISRRFGEQVFLITLHKPIWCGNLKPRSYCLPFAGQLDCEAAKVGHAMGFDVVGTPLAELRFDPDDYYAFGHPNLRFVDFTEGYVWSGPLESFKSVTIIPLNEYAPDEAAIESLRKSNPFNSEVKVSVARLQEIWLKETEARQNFLANRNWKQLTGWQSRCH